jgi:hypothetical protein
VRILHDLVTVFREPVSNTTGVIREGEAGAASAESISRETCLSLYMDYPGYEELAVRILWGKYFLFALIACVFLTSAFWWRFSIFL